MKIKKIVYLLLLFFSWSDPVKATNYYINSAVGKDASSGTSPKLSWLSISTLTNIQLKPGDSVLFATGLHFTGMLSLVNVKGLDQQPVVISSYLYKRSTAKPVLDAGQELNAILIQNCSFIQAKGIEITGVIPYQNNGISKKEAMRCGILVEVTQVAAFENIMFTDLVVHDVFFNAKGITRSAAETKSANGTQSYGWGIRFINNTRGGQLTNWPNYEGFQINKGGWSKVSPTGRINNSTGGFFTPYKNPTLMDGPAREYLTDRLTNECLAYL